MSSLPNFFCRIAVLPFLLTAFLLNGCTKKQPESTTVASSNQTTATVAAANTPPANANAEQPTNVAGNLDLSIDNLGLSKAVFVMKTSKGVIKFRLYAKDAPNSVKRFSDLVQQKFYNGLTFHRVVPGFVVQTGDPKSKNKNDPTIGTGGSGQKLRAEFNARKHIRGTVALARASDPDSADSQFYITLAPFPHLDNNYTVIGQVVDYGEKVGDKDVLDRLTQGDDLSELRAE